MEFQTPHEEGMRQRRFHDIDNAQSQIHRVSLKQMDQKTLAQGDVHSMCFNALIFFPPSQIFTRSVIVPALIRYTIRLNNTNLNSQGIKKPPPPLTNMLNLKITSTYLHKGSKNPPPPMANMLNLIIAPTYLHKG